MDKKINKRVSVGFSEEEYRVLQELSEQNGQPMAKIVSELVSTVMPFMKQMAEDPKVVNNMLSVVCESFRDSVESAFNEVTEYCLNRYIYQNKKQ